MSETADQKPTPHRRWPDAAMALGLVLLMAGVWQALRVPGMLILGGLASIAVAVAGARLE